MKGRIMAGMRQQHKKPALVSIPFLVPPPLLLIVWSHSFCLSFARPQPHRPPWMAAKKQGPQLWLPGRRPWSTMRSGLPRLFIWPGRSIQRRRPNNWTGLLDLSADIAEALQAYHQSCLDPGACPPIL